jgi:Sulfotransferase domain
MTNNVFKDLADRPPLLPRRMSGRESKHDCRTLNYSYQDGDAVKAGAVQIPATSLPDFRSFFLYSFFKSGSVLVNNIVREILKDHGIPMFDIPSHLFERGIDLDSFQCDLNQAFPAHGYCFSGYRHLPKTFFGSNAFKRARKVVVTRDPRDILVSAYFSIKFSHSFPDGATSQFRHMVRMQRRHTDLGIDDFCRRLAWTLNVELSYLQSVLDDKDTLVLRYEDFIYDKLLIGRSICDWCGIESSNERLAEIVKPHDFFPDVEQPCRHVRQGHPGDHCRKLQPATVKELDASLRTFLKTFGYFPSSWWKLINTRWKANGKGRQAPGGQKS